MLSELLKIYGIEPYDRNKKYTSDKYIYFICLNSEIIYIGSTNDLKDRLYRYNKKYFYTSVYVLAVEIRTFLIMERKYVRKFQPKYNIFLRNWNIDEDRNFKDFYEDYESINLIF